MKKNSPRLYALLKFLVKFNLLAIPLYLVLALNVNIVELQLATAQIVEWLLHLSAVPAVRDGLLITVPVSGGFWAAEIVWDCIGWKSMLFFLALVFATDAPMKKKRTALLFLPLIVLVNIARIWFLLYYVATFGLAHYALLHAVLWSWGLLLTVIVFWLIWLRYARNKARNA